MIDVLPEVLRTVLAFLVVLGVLVFVHELGHYLAARWRGVHVDAFSIGFGRPIARWTDRRGTEWRLSWIPLGGYVKLHGWADIASIPPEEAARLREGQTFHDKPVRDRAIVVAAGPIANFLLAALLFAALYATQGRPVATTAIAAVSPGSVAEAAGIRPGDEVVALDGRRVTRFEEVQRHIQPRAGVPVAITLRREGAEFTITVVPAIRPGSEAAPVGILGVQAGGARFERLDPLSALWAGSLRMLAVSGQTLAAVGEMILGQRSAQDLGGPLRIAEISGQAAGLGLVALVNLMALLSVSLALINLFPIPLLDGGHLVFYAIEALRGRPLPPRAMEIGFRLGFALLIALFLFATWNDLSHGGVGRWLAGLLG
ncbi:MAG: RIP metalloprotease RseP [Rhodovarius sp.]|nr:RIP metalloprotease RseP [Rhodovarius sp.]MCX7931758.1 RIP metalloprotease RseP [Rhodovarius sp.]MDW8314469.1 RIP metalloprotease RseP [Rhodovarius sp.]